MNYNQLIELQNETDYLDGVDIKQIASDILINGFIAFPIIISSSYNRSINIIAKYKGGRQIGFIRLLKGLHFENINSLPDLDKYCLFNDCERKSFESLQHTFEFDYLVIEKKYYNTYVKEYKDSSPAWGSFFHRDKIPSSIGFTQKSASDTIILEKGIKFSNAVYHEVFYLAVVEPNPFNRFLKLYHLLELQFDIHTAEKIKGLLDTGNEEKQIGKLLRDYSREDIERLKSLIQIKCADIEALVIFINNVKSFRFIAEEIFYDFGKQSNPLKSQKSFNEILDHPDQFEIEVVTQKVGNSLNYKNFICNLIAYWIYRIRSSIAHNKLGEYVMTSSDEKFIVEFAEPLLKEVVKQSFKK